MGLPAEPESEPELAPTAASWRQITKTLPENTLTQQVYSIEDCEFYGIRTFALALFTLQAKINETKNSLRETRAEMEKWEAEQQRRAWMRRRHALTAYYGAPAVDEMAEATAVVEARLEAEKEAGVAAEAAQWAKKEAHLAFRRQFYTSYTPSYYDDSDDDRDDRYDEDDEEDMSNVHPRYRDPKTLTEDELAMVRALILEECGYSNNLVLNSLAGYRKQMSVLQRRIRQSLSESIYFADPAKCVKFLFE
jgi:hypothetical protein